MINHNFIIHYPPQNLQKKSPLNSKRSFHFTKQINNNAQPHIKYILKSGRSASDRVASVRHWTLEGTQEDVTTSESILCWRPEASIIVDGKLRGYRSVWKSGFLLFPLFTFRSTDFASIYRAFNRR